MSPGLRRALVAGAGGYLGVAIVRGLVEQGWEVRGLVRNLARGPRVEGAGGIPVLGDILDPDVVNSALKGCEVVVHVAASSAPVPGDPERPSRVRVEGCRNLLRAAHLQGARRLVVGSGYWVYADQPGIITEESAVDPRGESRINFDTETAARELAAGGPPEVLVVRPGMVYGNGSWCRSTVESILAGTYSYVGDGTNPWSFVSLEDAGAGFVRVAEAGAAGQVYNLVDGRPAAWKEFGDFISERLSRPVPPSIPEALAASQMGTDVVHHLTARRACSAAKMEALGWKPRHEDFRAGIVATLPELATVGDKTRRKNP